MDMSTFKYFLEAVLDGVLDCCESFRASNLHGVSSAPGGEIDCVDKDGNTPLHIAARYGHELLINTLITSGADCTRWVMCFLPPNKHLQSCPSNALPSMTFCLLFRYVCRRGVHGMFPLHMAALNAHSDCCRKLLSSGMQRNYITHKPLPRGPGQEVIHKR